MRCERCGGQGESLGALGKRLWYRCRHCWHEWSTTGSHYE